MPILFFFFSCVEKEGGIGPYGGVLELLLLIIFCFRYFCVMFLRRVPMCGNYLA